MTGEQPTETIPVVAGNEAAQVDAAQASEATQEQAQEPAWYVDHVDENAPGYSGRHRDLSLAAVGRRIRRSVVVMMGSRRLWGSALVGVLVLIVAMLAVTHDRTGDNTRRAAAPNLPIGPATSASDPAPTIESSPDAGPSEPTDGSVRSTTGEIRPSSTAASAPGVPSAPAGPSPTTTGRATPTTPPPAVPPGPRTVEAESVRLGRGMQIVNLAAASGGKIVRLPDNGGVLSFTGIAMPNGGRYRVTLYYTCTGSTSAGVRANPGGNSPWDGDRVTCGGASTIRSAAFNVNLNSGANTVEVGFAGDSAQFDRIVVG